MTPFQCMHMHNPDENRYGDCVRACVASLMDIPPENVPHFFCDNDPVQSLHRLQEWLLEYDLAPFIAHLENCTLDELTTNISEQSAGARYLLLGSTVAGDHCMIYESKHKLHDPAWIPSDFIGPCSNGYWTIILITKR